MATEENKALVRRFYQEVWDRGNVEDFWNDAVVGEGSDYFIGSFVVYKSNEQHGPLYVVDGQQRLTTITILLAAVRAAELWLILPAVLVGRGRNFRGSGAQLVGAL